MNKKHPKLTLNGSSYKLVIPKGFVEYVLMWEDGQTVEYSAKDGKLIVEAVPLDATKRQPTFYHNSRSHKLTVPKAIIDHVLKWQDKQEVSYEYVDGKLIVSKVEDKPNE